MVDPVDDVGVTRRRRPGTERIASALTAQNVAVVGASDNSRWSLISHETTTRYGFGNGIFFVNRRGEPAHGIKTATSCVAIGERIDAALMLVKAEALEEAMRDAAAAGAHTVVTLAAGFGEAGPDGKAAQEALADLAADLDLTLFGPNCLGFVNFVDGVAAWAAPPPVPHADAGPIALVSQSGAIAVQLGRFASKQGVRFSHIISTGNEAMVGAIDVARTVVEDERVRCLAVFVEAIDDAAELDALAERAAALDKPIVMLKAGRSQLAAEVIASHTGSLAGDDKVVDIALRQAGVIRVDSLEDLVVTAALAARLPRLGRGKLGVVSISGGACDIVADCSATASTPLATFSAETTERLRGLGPLSGHNPLDVTGAAVGGAELMGDAIVAVAADPDVAIVGIVDVLPDGETVPAPSARLGVIAAAIGRIDKPAVVIHQVTQDIPAGPRDCIAELGIDNWICGIDRAVTAIGLLLHRSAWQLRAGAAALEPILLDRLPGSEVEALALLVEHGVPAIETRLATTADEAVVAADAIGYPVVVKVASAEIAHKSDAGGVELDLPSAIEVRAAFERVTAAGARLGASVDGAVVAPMRRGGVELIVGVVRDPQWGLLLAVGLGGLWVNVLDDSSLRRLPVDASTVRQMLGELKGAAVLEGARGTEPADLARVVDVIVSVSTLAERLGPRLQSLEINPLRVDGATVEALDAAVSWS